MQEYVSKALLGLEQAYTAGLARNMESVRCFEAAESTKSESMQKTLKETKEELALTWIGAQQWKTQSETSIADNSKMKVQMQYDSAQTKHRMHQESTELKGHLQVEYTTMQGQMQQEATFYQQHCSTLACEYQAELNLRPVVTLPEQEWAARLRMEEHQIAILRTSMHNVEQEVMRTEKDSEKKLEANTFKYLYEADACRKNLRSYREHVTSREEGMEAPRSGAVYSRNLAENADARLCSIQDQLREAEAESRIMAEAQEAMEFRISQVCYERNTAIEGIRDLRNELLAEQIAHQDTDTDHQQLLEEHDLLKQQTMPLPPALSRGQLSGTEVPPFAPAPALPMVTATTHASVCLAAAAPPLDHAPPTTTSTHSQIHNSTHTLLPHKPNTHYTPPQLHPHRPTPHAAPHQNEHHQMD